MPIFGQKNNNSVKTTFYFYLGSKKSIRCTFFLFSDFSRKISAIIPIHYQENVFSKNKMLSFPYYVKKNVNFLKNTVFSCPFFNIIMKNHLLSCPYLLKKRQICQKTLYYGPKKSTHLEKINIILANIIRGADGEKMVDQP